MDSFSPSSDRPRCALTRRSFVRSAAVGAAGLGVLVAAAARGVSAARRPNVLIVLTDDQGYGDFSCHGNPYLKTPNMDRLHDESVRLEDFHAAPMCTPTRGQLMTGVDALRNGATSVCYGRSFIRPSIPTMPEIFRTAGYRTGLFGKWHLGDSYPHRPMDRGFETAVYHRGWGLASAPEFDNDYFGGRCLRNGVPDRIRGYCTDFWFDEAMAWMRARAKAGEPFLCYLPTNAPHGPLWVDPKYAAPFEGHKPPLPAAFYGMILNLDENLGRLRAFLDETGLAENTIVVFMTDNGGTAGVRAFNAGMREGKTKYYDGGHRVPCFVRWPAGGLRPPGAIAEPTQLQDILPTLLDLTGVTPPPAARFDGISLVPSLRSADARLPERTIVVQYGQDLVRGQACVIRGRWRLVKDAELYDIAADPAQKNDLAAAHPDVVARLREDYARWWAGVAPTLDDRVCLSLGAEAENPVTLSSSDWQDVYCDNTQAVRAGLGGPRGGPWNVFVERAGDYEIELRRWPAHAGVALAAPLPAQDMAFGRLEAGKALPIAGAKVTIAGQERAQPAGEGTVAVTFRLPLQAGRAQLQAWFVDAAGKDVCGAYYATVRRA